MSTKGSHSYVLRKGTVRAKEAHMELVRDATAALVILVKHIERERERRDREQPPTPLRAQFVTVAEMEEAALRSRFADSLSRIVEQPEEEAYRLAVRWIGERLFERGGIEMLQRVHAQRVFDGRACATLSSAWDGVGNSWFC